MAGGDVIQNGQFRQAGTYWTFGGEGAVVESYSGAEPLYSTWFAYLLSQYNGFGPVDLESSMIQHATEPLVVGNTYTVNFWLYPDYIGSTARTNLAVAFDAGSGGLTSIASISYTNFAALGIDPTGGWQLVELQSFSPALPIEAIGTLGRIQFSTLNEDLNITDEWLIDGVSAPVVTHATQAATNQDMPENGNLKPAHFKAQFVDTLTGGLVFEDEAVLDRKGRLRCQKSVDKKDRADTLNEGLWVPRTDRLVDVIDG